MVRGLVSSRYHFDNVIFSSGLGSENNNTRNSLLEGLIHRASMDSGYNVDAMDMFDLVFGRDVFSGSLFRLRSLMIYRHHHSYLARPNLGSVARYSVPRPCSNRESSSK